MLVQETCLRASAVVKWYSFGRVRPESSFVVGLFVGGRSRRMGGRPKGLLCAPDGGGTLAGRALAKARLALPACEVCLVGTVPDYENLHVPALADDPPDIGPLGGLAALLSFAQRRGAHAIAMACDHPFVGAELIARLAHFDREVAAVAPRRGDRWEPLMARYAPSEVLPVVRAQVAQGRHSLQSIFVALGERARALPSTPGDERDLLDWDTPEDIVS